MNSNNPIPVRPAQFIRGKRPLQVSRAGDENVGNTPVSPDFLPQARHELSIRNIRDMHINTNVFENLRRVLAAIDNDYLCAATNEFSNARKTDPASPTGYYGQTSIEIWIVFQLSISLFANAADDFPETENKYAKTNAIGVEIRVE
jgi:hypothetical protein